MLALIEKPENITADSLYDLIHGIYSDESYTFCGVDFSNAIEEEYDGEGVNCGACLDKMINLGLNSFGDRLTNYPG